MTAPSAPAELHERPEHSAVRTIADLPEFFSAAGNDWHLDLMETACKLMDTPELALLQVSSDLVVAFRYHDVMELSVTREAGNMPIELLAGQSTRRQTGALRSGTEPAGERRAIFRMLADQAFTHNPPLHKFTRRTLSRQILRQNMLRLLPLASEIIASLLAGIRGRSEIDFAADFARPYIASFWGNVLGLTREESAEVGELMRDMNRMFLMQRTPGDSGIIDQAADRYVEIVTRRVDRSLAARDSQLIVEMAADLAGIDVEGKPESLGQYVAANLFDGFHTVGVAVSNALYVLLAAGRYEEMRREPSLVPKAVHESLRIAPPLLLTHRYALSDIVHDGVLLPAGTAIAMLWGSPASTPMCLTNHGSSDGNVGSGSSSRSAAARIYVPERPLRRSWSNTPSAPSSSTASSGSSSTVTHTNGGQRPRCGSSWTSPSRCGGRPTDTLSICLGRQSDVGLCAASGWPRKTGARRRAGKGGAKPLKVREPSSAATKLRRQASGDNCQRVEPARIN